MIERTELLRQVEYGLKRYAVTAILGPRQCGKTTLAREIGRREQAVYLGQGIATRPIGNGDQLTVDEDR